MVKDYMAPALSAGLFLLTVAALAVTVITKDDAGRQLVLGAIIAQFTQVVQFYVGSSSSSQKKDEIIAASVPPGNGMAVTGAATVVATGAEEPKP